MKSTFRSRLLLIVLCLTTISILPGCVGKPSISAGIVRRPPSFGFRGRGVLTSLPKMGRVGDKGFLLDLRHYDLQRLDLRHSLPDLLCASFDSRTIWPPPDRMPSGYDWRAIMERGKNPGLGVRSLHARGITGRGIGIAIIDQPLLTEHQEYAARLRVYEEVNVGRDDTAAMHGPGVASIAVGSTVGVAPGADLYYIGNWPGALVPEAPVDFAYLAKAVRRILAINKNLPRSRRIRVLSLSIGWGPEQAGYNEIKAAVEEAKASGIFVVSSSLQETYGFWFHGLARSPYADPDSFSSYVPGSWWAEKYYPYSGSDRLLVPMELRTTAGPGGKDEYVFYHEGGWSWVYRILRGYTPWRRKSTRG